MEFLLFWGAAFSGYFISGINPAIILSNAVYGKDIRELGSHNPGFTNFKRVFGMKWAITVMIVDLLKSALPAILFGHLFDIYLGGQWHLGVTFTCLFSMLGHAFPVWYGFEGGKGFLVCLSAMWTVDWLVGAVATALMIILLLITKYMSLSTTLAMLSCPITMLFLEISIIPVMIATISVIFMAIRHKENFVRLANGTESRFSFSKK